jgi:hypothetical protein
VRQYLAWLPVLALVACDPDLTVKQTPGATPEGGTTPPGAPPPPPTDTDGGATDGGDEGGADGGSDAGKSHQVDGLDDFAPGDKLATTSTSIDASYHAYAAWDATSVFFGIEGADVAQSTGSANKKWVFLYLGAPGVAGSNTGIAYDCGGACPAQQATLPFPAAWHVRYKIDGTYANVQKWSGSAWVDATASITLTTGRQGTFLEMGLQRAQLGDPAKLDVHVNMLIEDQHPPAWTYAGAPSTSFTDGFAPTFTKYFEFDLGDAAKAPNSYTPKP